MTAADILSLMTEGGPWGLLAIVGWRLFQREKALDEVNKEARQLATETATANARLATLVETMVNRK